MIENAPVPRALREWLAGAILSVGIILVFVVFQATRMTELADVRAMDLAQVARNLATGQGMTTDFIRPLSLAEVPRIQGHPDLAHTPLHLLVMSALFRLGGVSNQTISWSSGLPFLLTIPVVCLLGWRIFSRKVGVLSALVLGTNAIALTTAASGTEGALLGLLFTLLCAVLVYHQLRPALRLPLTITAGVLTALLYLTHITWLVAFVPALLVIVINSTGRRRVPHAVIFAVAFALAAAPWLYRVYHVTGSPLTNLSAYDALVNTRTFSGNLIYRSFMEHPPGVLSAMVSAPREIYERARPAAMDLFPLLFSIAGLVTTPFFVVAMLVPLGQVPLDRLRPGLYALLILLFPALCITTADGRLLVPLAPVITIVCVAFFYQLLDLRLRPLTERLRLRWTTGAVVLLMALHMFPLVLQLAPGRPITPALPLAIKRAAGELSFLIPQASGHETAPAPVLTDMPWAVAWCADRPAVWLPRTDVDLRRIEQSMGQIRWLVLTPQIVDVARAEQATGWAELWRRAITKQPLRAGWRVRQIFANGNWVLFERVPDVASVGTLPSAPAQ